jgi:hypothetical protein
LSLRKRRPIHGIAFDSGVLLLLLFSAAAKTDYEYARKSEDLFHEIFGEGNAFSTDC